MIRASQILFWFGLSITASLALYHTSDQVHELDRQLRTINDNIDNERQSIHVLKAEWAYLSNPARMEAEAHRHLATLRYTSPQQVVSLANIGDDLPMQEETAASASVVAAPIATIKTSLAAPPMPEPLPAVRKMALAANDTGRVNDRMIIQHGPPQMPSEQSADQIGALIGTLGTHP